MDFAGGTAVHITSGTTVLAFYIFYALQTNRLRMFKPKPVTLDNDIREYPASSNQAPQILAHVKHHHNGDTPVSASNSFVIVDQEDAPTPLAQDIADPDPETGTTGAQAADKAPHNVNNMVLGTALLWIGWFGFNGGSALGGNLRAASACVATHVAACSGGTTMLLLFWASNYIDREVKKRRHGTDESDARNPSITHFCDGVVIALVAITPGAGFVGPFCSRYPPAGLADITSRSRYGALVSLASWLPLSCSSSSF
jgi:Amt family ammonium transporter